MAKIKLDHHASAVLARCEETGEFLLGQYDAGYCGENAHWIGRVKLLGGNYFFGKDTDTSPHETLEREIREEFSGENATGTSELAASQEHIFAPLAEISLVRNALLNTAPYQDFFLRHPGTEGKKGQYIIQSVFRAQLPREVIECVRTNIARGKSLTNEGVVVIRSIDELVKGNPLTQGITGLIISHSEGVLLPHCLRDLFTAAPIGLPRQDYKDYLDTFEHRNHSGS